MFPFLLFVLVFMNRSFSFVFVFFVVVFSGIGSFVVVVVSSRRRIVGLECISFVVFKSTVVAKRVVGYEKYWLRLQQIKLE